MLKEYEFSDKEPRYSEIIKLSPLTITNSPMPIKSKTGEPLNDKISSDMSSETSEEECFVPKTPKKQSRHMIADKETLTTQYLMYYNQLNSAKKKEARSRLGSIVSQKS
ncbi:hypothetical protein HMI55_005289 [Coelomomyces lativittatus]|nr:hypothetical protein HMI55_005289 [Coelomomyces lativittatus]KAJ1505121.1 hypothetical protein HMI56_001294 [Coelomomyces lativittatus]